MVHITDRARWAEQQAAAGPVDNGGYRHPSLDGGGFIHCSTVDQFLIPANERFRGRGDLILLIVATGRLSAPLVYEDCYESGHRFPHVYGPIDLDAIVDVVDLPCRLDGCFDRPPDIEVRLSRLSDELC